MERWRAELVPDLTKASNRVLPGETFGEVIDRIPFLRRFVLVHNGKVAGLSWVLINKYMQRDHVRPGEPVSADSLNEVLVRAELCGDL